MHWSLPPTHRDTALEPASYTRAREPASYTETGMLGFPSLKVTFSLAEDAG